MSIISQILISIIAILVGIGLDLVFTHFYLKKVTKDIK